MAEFTCTDDFISILIAENVGLRTVQHLLRKNHELYNELRSQHLIRLAPLLETTRKDGRATGLLPPDNAPQEAREGSNAAGSRPGHSFNRVTPIQRDLPQRAFTGSPLSPGGCKLGPIPIILQRSQPPPVFSPTHIATAARPMCSVSPEQKASPFPGTLRQAQAGSVYPVGPLGLPPNWPIPGQHQVLAGSPQPLIPTPMQASVSLPIVQVTLTYHGGAESSTVSAAQLSAPRAIGQTCADFSHAGTGASMGQAYTHSSLASGVRQAHTGSPQTAATAAAHNVTSATGTIDTGSLSAAAPQRPPTSCCPSMQQLAQAYSLLSPGSPPLSLGQTYFPQERAFFPPSIPSPQWAFTPSPVLPQAPAGPPALQKPHPVVLQPPPPGWKARKPPSPGAASRPDSAPPEPPAALPAWAQHLQSPPHMWPKEREVLTNQETALKMSSETRSKGTSRHGTNTSESKEESLERTVGEIANHLGSRMFFSIFPELAGICGSSAHDVPKMVTEVSAIMERYATLMNRLKPLGYDPNVHPKLTEQIVKTFGTLQERPPDAACFNDIQYVRDLVKETAPPDLLSDCLILLDCLYQLSLDNGEPLFSWQPPPSLLCTPAETQ